MKKPTKAKLKARLEAALLRSAELREDYRQGALEVNHTPSGLTYVILEAGEGPLARAGQNVATHFVGSLADKGSVFDESFSRPKPFRFQLGSGAVIPGFDEVMGLLPGGSEALVIIPARLGYGPKGRGQGVPPNSDLLFYLETE